MSEIEKLEPGTPLTLDDAWRTVFVRAKKVGRYTSALAVVRSLRDGELMTVRASRLRERPEVSEDYAYRAGRRARQEEVSEALQEVVEDLERVGCTFFACKGPDAPFESMATCRVCASIQEIRKLMQQEG